MNSFAKGFLSGAISMLALALVVGSLVFFHRRDKKLFEAMEVQIETQKIIDDVSGRNPQRFVDELPGVRAAADGGVECFNRKRDEAVERIRGGRVD
jgi:hypothetical protein